MSGTWSVNLGGHVKLGQRLRNQLPQSGFRVLGARLVCLTLITNLPGTRRDCRII
jgi:hypothetical protein